MTAYPRPAKKERIVARLNPCAKTTASAGQAPGHPVGRPFQAVAGDPGPRAGQVPGYSPTSFPEVDDDACIEFAESRRTGNIEVTLKSFAAREATVEKDPQAPSPVLKAAPSALDCRPRPHAGMPEAAGDFCNDLRILDAVAPAASEESVMEELMTPKTAEPASESAHCGSGTPVYRRGVDVRLARIIEAWPQLSARTRAAMTATLHDAESLDGPSIAASHDPQSPLAVRSARRSEVQAKNAATPSRRRSRSKG